LRTRRIAAIGAVVAGGALVLAGCSAPQQSEVVEDSTVTVAWNQPFYSYNGNTSFGNATANNNIIYATNSWFNYYNDVPELVQDTSFGTYELVSEDPLTVSYTVNEGVTWSDGNPVDAGDLLLVWAANSGVLNDEDFDPAEYTDPDTGEFTEDYPTDVVFFDGAIGAGLERVVETPEISDDGRTITLTYDSQFVDWELAFVQGLPAHVVAKNALGIEDGTEAEEALVTAIQDDDREALAAISSFWNSGFNFSEMPSDPELVLATGPYIITDFVADQYIELSANEAYTGDHTPQVETVTVRFIPDPLAAVQALENGEVDIIQPQATADVADALNAIDGITVLGGYEGTYEHIDLQFDQSKSGHFNNPLVREAFLKTFPRQQIVDNLIVPLQADAEVRNSQMFLPGAEGYDEAAETNGMADFTEPDIDGAIALLAEAGVTSPEVCILYASNNPRRVNEFALIQASAAQAGFNVTDCGSPQWGGLLGTAGAYDASLFGWQSTSLGVTNASANYRTGGINNLNFYSNPEVDELLSQLDVEFDADRQIELQLEIDKLLMADFYGLTIFQFPSTAAFSDRVANVSASTLAPTIFWNIWEWEPTETNVVEE
jgi:peptide/nickel transport system substrate-binding protein